MATRKVDSLGRIVIPQDMREKLKIIDNATYLDIELKGTKIVISRAKASCLLCGGRDGVLEKTRVCVQCAQKILDEMRLADQTSRVNKIG